jgi:hypothetical protein
LEDEHPGGYPGDTESDGPFSQLALRSIASARPCPGSTRR